MTLVGWFCWDGLGSIDEVAKLARDVYIYIYDNKGVGMA